MWPPRKSLRKVLGRAGFVFVPAPLLPCVWNRDLKSALYRDIPSKEFIASTIRVELTDLYRACHARRDVINEFGWDNFWSDVKQHVSWAKNDAEITETLLERLVQKISEAREKYHAFKIIQSPDVDTCDESLFQAVDTWIDYLRSSQSDYAPYSHLALPQTTTEPQQIVDMMEGLVLQRAENSSIPRSKQWKQKVKEAHKEELAQARGRSHPTEKIGKRKRKGRNADAGAQGNIEDQEMITVPRDLKRTKREKGSLLGGHDA
ncbi:uncharacterized protein F4807DRAFT_464795 [Annulohypoxylon truncatum]|uniref:uncharacterized protein n=1 Tax=Annulohypoxylon truncatum TaxID=327061 RepID=UPI002008C5EF|nr:uncharacterized protein F4807DRAFT_464795 [Annulohypoxylon truncatum]KAI1205316.1 hypothetical protein F4807DRAFT_464795 [Annulohypoxylon truncatum]